MVWAPRPSLRCTQWESIGIKFPAKRRIGRSSRIGLRVVDAYVKAAVNTRDELGHLVHNIAPVTGATIAPAKVSESHALSAAAAAEYPSLKASIDRKSVV